MKELHFPWLDLLVLLPLLGSLHLSRYGDAFRARIWGIIWSAVTLLVSVAAWQDFHSLHVFQADDKYHLLTRLIGDELFDIDEVSAPLLPLTALLFFLTILSTQRTKLRRFSCSRTLLIEGLLLATFACKQPWLIVALLAVGTLPPYFELRERRRCTRIYVWHMAAFVVLMVLGWIGMMCDPQTGGRHSLWAILPLLGAVLIRSGIAPAHCWMTDLFENVGFGTALLTAAPLSGVYLAVRLMLPIAPDGILRTMGLISLATAVYASGMALVQRDARRFFCYLFLSNSALVLVGLEIVTPIGLTGALCVWISVAMSLGGFGLALRAVEARRGRLSLDDLQGLYDQTPALAVCFFLTGLASVGFPGTLGFVGTELIVDGAVEIYPYVGVAVVIAAALNGIGIVRTYFWLFTGKRHVSTVSLQIDIYERIAVTSLAILLLGGGLLPQAGVLSRHHAAKEILRQRGVPKLTEFWIEGAQDGPAELPRGRSGRSQRGLRRGDSPAALKQTPYVRDSGD